MQKFSKGKYLGENTFEHRRNGLIFLQTRYDDDFSSDWHFHENPLFAFTLKGGSIEKRKKGTIESSAGMLVLYNTQEGHQNEKYKKGTRNFIIEFENFWFEQMQIDRRDFEGNVVVENQEIKDLLLKTIAEARNQNSETQIALEMLVVDMFARLLNEKARCSVAPKWLSEIKNLLHDSPNEKFSLAQLADLANIHPVTISKLFPRFFGSTVGEYVRGIKLEKSLKLLAQKHLPIETIARRCGFTDHAHFSKVFKKRKGITPSRYREIIFG